MLIHNKLMLRFTLLVLAIQVSFSAFIYYFNASTRRSGLSTGWARAPGAALRNIKQLF